MMQYRFMVTQKNFGILQKVTTMFTAEVLI